MLNQVIYLLGADGSGKTTYLDTVEKELNKKGITTRHIWIRSPKIFSKPLMAYCRLVKLTKYETIDGIKYGIHEFYKSPFVSWLFPILQLIDFNIKWFQEKRKVRANDTLLFDRFCLDTLADLMVDTKRFDLHKTWIGKAFIKKLPNNCKTIVLNVDAEIIRSRKKDTLYDKSLDSKVKVYKLLSKDLNLRVIDNNRAFEAVEKEIIKNTIQ